MKLRLVTASICLAIGTMAIAHGIVREDAQLVGGTPTVGESSPFPSVVELSTGCTATKVGSKTFLTAAHCVFDFAARGKQSDYHDNATLSITNNPNPRSTSWKSVTIETTIVDPGFQTACSAVTCDDDIVNTSLDVAVFRIKEDTASIPVAAVDYRFVLPADPVFIMGYGCETGSGPSAPQGVPGDPTLPFGRLKYQATRVSRDTVAELVGIPVLSPSHLLNFFTAGKPTDPTSASLCPGDSGGPVILNLPEGRYVVGVNSGGYGDSATDATPVNQHARLTNAVVWMPSEIR